MSSTSAETSSMTHSKHIRVQIPVYRERTSAVVNHGGTKQGSGSGEDERRVPDFARASRLERAHAPDTDLAIKRTCSAPGNFVGARFREGPPAAPFCALQLPLNTLV